MVKTAMRNVPESAGLSNYPSIIAQCCELADASGPKIPRTEHSCVRYQFI